MTVTLFAHHRYRRSSDQRGGSRRERTPLERGEVGLRLALGAVAVASGVAGVVVLLH